MTDDKDGFDWLTVDYLIDLLATNERGYLRERVLPDGRWLGVIPLTFARARIVIASSVEAARFGYDDGW